MLKLFPDQEEVMNNLRQAIRRRKSVLLQSPTGSGKTVMAIDMVINSLMKDRKCLFSVPRRDLMMQTSKTFKGYGIPHSFIAAGKDFNPFANAYIGMVDTMSRRVSKNVLPKVDLVIVDETHYGAAALDRVINHYKDQGAWIIGLSATPWKMSGQGLDIWYDEMVLGKSIPWLIENKRLSDYRYFYGKTRPDFSGIKVTAGDYNKGQIADYMEQQGVIIGDAVKDYKMRCMDKLHLIRCTSIKHSQITAEAFRNAGIAAVHVDGETPDDIKLQIFKDFALRKIKVLTFADLLNFGFDLSQASGEDVCVESISDMKPSMSLAGQMQFWGRALRYKDFPAIMNDHVNNYVEHGLPCSERDWTLESKKKKQKGEPVPATRQCSECFYVHPPAPQCPECGHTYPIVSRQIDHVDGELEEIDKEAVKLKKRQQQGAAKNLDDLIKLGKERGYKNPAAWASKIMAARMKKRIA